MLIAVAGLAGAGKTTAVEHLEAAGVGRQIYVGAYIQAELGRRNLPLTAENERFVRDDMRRLFGRDVFAKMVVTELGDAASNQHLLLDAIYAREEADCYRQGLGVRVVILGLDAGFNLRAERLARRPDRPLTREELRERDAYECETLRVHEIVAGADHRLSNEGDLASFRGVLEALSAQW